ncbi:MAG: formyltransferase family protein [Pseudomonadota bacterium]
MTRLGIVCSSGGAVFVAAMDLLRECGYRPVTVVVTDRPCGVENECERLGIEWRRIEDPTREGFSRQAAAWLFDKHQVDWTCLFFSRLVSSDLFARGICLNIHPSILPAFPGFGAVRRTLESGSRFMGATAHLTDESSDAGPILGQVIAPIPHGASVQLLERLSFAQKLYLLLVLWELAEHDALATLIDHDVSASVLPILSWANPALQDQRLAEAFNKFLRNEGIEWLR